MDHGPHQNWLPPWLGCTSHLQTWKSAPIAIILASLCFSSSTSADSSGSYLTFAAAQERLPWRSHQISKSSRRWVANHVRIARDAALLAVVEVMLILFPHDLPHAQVQQELQMAYLQEFYTVRKPSSSSMQRCAPAA